MREIKFRTWNKSESEMYYNAELTYDFGMNGSSVMEESFGGIITNDDFILMQYTGVKDINGKEIYEGDIVEYFSQSAIGYGVKKYIINYTFNAEWALGNHWLLSRKWRYCEVIGNKFENPELLKEVE